VKREGRVGLETAGMAEEGLAKAIHTPNQALFDETLLAEAVIGQVLLFQIFIDECLPQWDPI
jgi:hypothetical protein